MFAPMAWFGVVASDPQFSWLMPDDAFYYSVTARNFVELGWPTFDTLNPTNGFHPFYFLLVSGIAAVTSPDHYLNAIYLLHFALLLVAFLKVARITRFAPLWALLVFIPIIASEHWLRSVSRNPGMESALAFAAAIYFFDAFRSTAEVRFTKAGLNVAFGAAATVLMLARLDTIILVIPVAIAAAVWSGASVPVRRLPAVWICLFAIPLVCCSAYLAINLATTGHLSPVSGAAKWAFRMPWEVSLSSMTMQYALRGILTFLLPLLMAVIATYAGIGMMRRENHGVGASLLLAGFGIGLYYLYLRFGATNAFNWYLGAVTGVSTWILATLVSKIRSPPLPRPAAIVLCALGLFFAVENFEHNTRVATIITNRVDDLGRTHKLSDLGVFLAKNAEPGDVAATFDAGKIGYFSSVPVINLDGLANSYRYLEDVRRTGKFKEYFEEMGVSHFLARGSLLSNRDAVLDGTYETTTFRPDPRLVFSPSDEIHRDVVDEGFLVVVFRYPPASADR